MRCPSCQAAVPVGETICMECGTELVLGSERSGPQAAVPDAPVADAGTAGVASAGADLPELRVCPDCGEHVHPDRNGWCPACGHPFDGDELPLLHPDAERRQRMRSSSFDIAAFVEDVREEAETSPEEDPTEDPPEDPLEEEFRALQAAEARGVGSDPVESGAAAEAAATTQVRDEAPPRLRLGADQEVFFEGRMCAEIPLDVDELLIGRRDPSQGHYPEIDLTHYRHVDPHISRRHARLLREEGRWFVADLCRNDATWLNDRAHVLNAERAPLEHGDRILISDSVVLTFLALPDT